MNLVKGVRNNRNKQVEHDNEDGNRAQGEQGIEVCPLSGIFLFIAAQTQIETDPEALIQVFSFSQRVVDEGVAETSVDQQDQKRFHVLNHFVQHMDEVPCYRERPEKGEASHSGQE